VACRFESGDDFLDVSIRWVAPTPEDAKALLQVDRTKVTEVDVGDEAYAGGEGTLVMRTGRYIVVIGQPGPDRKAATELASVISDTLQKR
jgi:hypothetical protein